MKLFFASHFLPIFFFSISSFAKYSLKISNKKNHFT